MIIVNLNGLMEMCSECMRHPCHPQCPNSNEPKVIGYCEECGDRLREDYEYYTDNEGSKFCTRECAIKYHGIESKEWDYE